MFPFGKDGVDCLTTPEKIAIFSSDENPMEMIIVKVNLDVNKPNHHNVGIPDLHSGYGIIFDGDKWITERINVIMNVLLDSKEKDLLKIHGEIKDFLSEDVNKTIKDTLGDLNHNLNRGNHIDIKSKKTLIAHLKKHFYSNKNLVIEAKKHTMKELHINNNHNKFKNILKDGVTIEDVDNHIRNKKELENKINNLKEMCRDLLKLSKEKKNIDEENYDIISKRIDDMDEISTINVIINSLILSAYFKEKINDKIITKKIAISKEMCSFLI